MRSKRNKLYTKFFLLLICCFSIFFRNEAAISEPLLPARGKSPATCVAKPLRFILDQEKSVINFLLKGNIHDTHGSVSRIKGEVSALALSNGRFKKPEVTIRINSDDLDTKHEGRDRRMKKFLEVEKFPEITFHATEIKPSLETLTPFTQATREQPLLFDLWGNLTLHGKTKKIIVKISTYQFNDRLITEGSTVLSLKDFAIRNPSLLFLRVSNEVKINFHIESTHKISL